MIKEMFNTHHHKAIAVLDLKSFYAVVECVERGLDPFKTPLIVADPERGQGTIVLAVSPYLRKKGIPSRLRVFELPKLDETIIFATPRMSLYLEKSAQVVSILLDYVGEDDLHVYSIDEAFLNLGPYLELYRKTPEAIMKEIMHTIRTRLGLYSTVGIGDNAFLAKSALDNESKKAPDGIAYWRQGDMPSKLWTLPIGEMWGVASRMEARLHNLGIFTIGDLAHYPRHLLKKWFGVMGEQLHDHANGIDESDIRDKYIPSSHGLSMGQVFYRDYRAEEVPIVIREMVDDLALRLRLENKLTSLVHLSIAYSKGMGGFSHQMSLIRATDDGDVLTDALLHLFHKYVDTRPIRVVTFAFNKLEPNVYHPIDLFTDPEVQDGKRRLQHALDKIKARYGKNAVLRTSALLEASTTIKRHELIGGHRR